MPGGSTAKQSNPFGSSSQNNSWGNNSMSNPWGGNAFGQQNNNNAPGMGPFGGQSNGNQQRQGYMQPYDSGQNNNANSRMWWQPTNPVQRNNSLTGTQQPLATPALAQPLSSQSVATPPAPTPTYSGMPPMAPAAPTYQANTNADLQTQFMNNNPAVPTLGTPTAPTTPTPAAPRWTTDQMHKMMADYNNQRIQRSWAEQNQMEPLPSQYLTAGNALNINGRIYDIGKYGGSAGGNIYSDFQDQYSEWARRTRDSAFRNGDETWRNLPLRQIASFAEFQQMNPFNPAPDATPGLALQQQQAAYEQHRRDYFAGFDRFMNEHRNTADVLNPAYTAAQQFNQQRLAQYNMANPLDNPEFATLWNQYQAEQRARSSSENASRAMAQLEQERAQRLTQVPEAMRSRLTNLYYQGS